MIKGEVSFAIAKFIFLCKWVLGTEVNSLVLVTALILLIRKMSGVIVVIF